LRRARALGRRIPAPSARTQVHRRDELEASREERLAARAGDGDRAVLEWLPERLQGRPGELGKLVEKEDAAVREARLAWPRPDSAADDRRHRRAVVGRTKGRR